MNKLTFTTNLCLITIALSIFIGGCSPFKADGDCPCTVDASTLEIEAMKDVILNVNKNKPNQLFHVQPVIKDSSNCTVGIVALVGEVKLTTGGDSIVSITFDLVHEDSSRHKLSLQSVTKEPQLNQDPSKPRVFTINTITDARTGPLALETYKFDTPRVIGENGYHGDINFVIDGIPATTIPRICEFIID